MELHYRNGKMLVLLKNKAGKIVRAYSGEIAKTRWNEMFNHLNLY
jgi:hypothetical protein